MTTRLDEDPEFGPDDPLAVILRPASEHLAPPPGRYESIRRTASRRRLFRAAAGAGLTCAVATLIALPVQLAGSEAPARPTVPLAPPPASGRTTPPTTQPVSPVPSKSPEDLRPSRDPAATDISRPPSATAVPTPGSVRDSPSRGVPSEASPRS
ncbi:hypothetical protein [Streptomyces sp. GESEQ-35]|uniref:hypothetical protein n=1 Tax=Streptomyces sp. GESEQ-35 TaxID=2812657 RepID=UPI001B3351B3|nr:hypothetical protein [Streptomyces sp. GESEQ-35]